LGGGGYLPLVWTSLLAFLVPAILFSLVPPVAVGLLTAGRPTDGAQNILGNVLAVGTLGSVSGALAAAFVLIPWVGLSRSLQIFALLAVGFAILISRGRAPVIPGVVLLACLLIPQPDFHLDSPLELLEQREGYYQTIRVFADGAST
jgi:hypothetical protein